MLVRDRFFVIVPSTSGSDAVVPDMLRLAGLVTSGLPAGRPLAVFSDLPQASLVRQSLRLIGGPHGLQAVDTSEDGDVQQGGGRIAGVAVDYAGSA